jgi:hypothetical protein
MDLGVITGEQGCLGLFFHLDVNWTERRRPESFHGDRDSSLIGYKDLEVPRRRLGHSPSLGSIEYLIRRGDFFLFLLIPLLFPLLAPFRVPRLAENLIRNGDIPRAIPEPDLSRRCPTQGAVEIFRSNLPE